MRAFYHYKLNNRNTHMNFNIQIHTGKSLDSLAARFTDIDAMSKDRDTFLSFIASQVVQYRDTADANMLNLVLLAGNFRDKSIVKAVAKAVACHKIGKSGKLIGKSIKSELDKLRQKSDDDIIELVAVTATKVIKANELRASKAAATKADNKADTDSNKGESGTNSDTDTDSDTGNSESPAVTVSDNYATINTSIKKLIEMGHSADDILAKVYKYLELDTTPETLRKVS